MRRLIAAVAVALGLLTMQAVPAGATVLPPGAFVTASYGSCVVVGRYDTFGSGFATMAETEGAVCSYQTRIRVKVIPSPGAPTVFAPWCDLTGRFTEPNDPYGDACVYSGLTTMSVAGGYAVGFEMRLCPNLGQCALFKYNILGP